MSENNNYIYIINLELIREFLSYKALSAAYESQFNLLSTANFVNINGHRDLSRRI